MGLGTAQAVLFSRCQGKPPEKTPVCPLVRPKSRTRGTPKWGAGKTFASGEKKTIGGDGHRGGGAAVPAVPVDFFSLRKRRPKRIESMGSQGSQGLNEAPGVSF